MDIEAGTVVAGKYRVIKRLSGGGMGSVWLGHHSQLDAPVVLKFMHGSLLDVQGSRARFEREAKAAAAIRSPYIVHVYDHGIDPELEAPFIVMEYLEGEDLRQRIKRDRQPPHAEVVRICEQVCKGLNRAHKLGIVHRDLKPGNIFLNEADEGMVKILDFGIAKETGKQRVVSGEMTTTGQVLGSPHYMSPEQARGQTLDGRSDLWSVAVIMYRLVTGQRPFRGDDIGDVIVRICTDPVEPASKHDPRLRPVVDRFFERAFDRDPDARFQTAKAFAAEFKAALIGGSAFVDARDSQEFSVPPAPSVSEPGSWSSKDSSSFTSAYSEKVPDDEALTQVTPSLLNVETITNDASDSLRVADASRRRTVVMAAAAAVGIVLIGAAVMAAFGSDPADAKASATVAPLPVVAPSLPPVASEATAEPSAAKSAEPTPSASASAAAKRPKRPVVRSRAPVRRRAPKPKPTRRTDSDLGY